MAVSYIPLYTSCRQKRNTIKINPAQRIVTLSTFYVLETKKKT